MAEKKSKQIVLAVIVWLVILGAVGITYKQFIHPHLKKKLEVETSSESRYRYEVKMAHDSFSGYCILRSESVFNRLTAAGIRLVLKDDRADYLGRIKALKDGDVDMAVFTVDALIKSSAQIKDFPATIVMIIDETKGADAIVAYKSLFPNVQSLNRADVRIVLTPNSPSETLARVVIAHFALPSLPPNWWIEEDGAKAVYKKLKDMGMKEKLAYVLWEPYVSKALEDSDVYVLMDSSNITGYIVDVLVARREYLRDNPGIVNTIVGAYLGAVGEYQQEPDGMVNLVLRDAEKYGEKINREQAYKLVKGIQWKNQAENQAHLGLLPEQEKGLQHIEDIINQITEVLVTTGALTRDPLEGNASRLFYDGVVRSLQSEEFQPGKKLDILKGVEIQPTDKGEIREEPVLPGLNNEDWDKLVPVGEVRVNPISFARGTARINVESQRVLDEQVRRLKAWPKYYLLVEGHARSNGDIEANTKLASERAQVVAQYLISKGISQNRIRAVAIKPSGSGGQYQTVSFIFYQRP
jgi:outer membrane protein OmpA-like peptidoglycan-associated protein/ABC-type nitrate/sulfonate/bicarbonate transport system substrate-binding protein